jgi:uncharacterized membrane protein YiaA
MNNTDRLNEIQHRLVCMSEGLIAIGVASSTVRGDEDIQAGLAHAVFIMGHALDDLTLKLEEVINPELQESPAA